MAHDVRDVLNLPAEAGGPRPSKKQKTGAPRPNLKGLAREVQNLGGDNPIAIVPEVSTFKKRRFASRKPAARWHMAPFSNSARTDGTLHLRHWRKQSIEQPKPPELQDAAPPPNGTAPSEAETPATKALEDSAFSKFNVQVDVPSYTDDQYAANLATNEWTKDETDYLMGLAGDFDLRWPLIWDRYEYQPYIADTTSNGEATDPNTAVVPAPKPRTMEDLKARYYEIAAKMMAIDTPVHVMTQAQYNLHETLNNFNPASEQQRKKFAETALTRSKEEAREEESLLIEVRRILARTERFNQERRDLYNRLDYPIADHDINSFKSSSGLHNLLQTLASSDKTKKRKSIMEANGSATPSSAQPAAAQAASTPASESRRESVAASNAGNHRDSIGGNERPEKPSKKGAQQPERKKLSAQEERIYGVSHHDRLPTGPTFRYERINKILTTKSHAQHQRIVNTLNELDIPPRLNMPTRSVVEEMEKLLQSINVLLDIRKVNDKIDAELQLEKAKKAERDKALAPAKPEPESTEDKNEGGEGEQENEKEPEKATQDDGAAPADSAQPDAKAADTTAPPPSNDDKAGESTTDKNAPDTSNGAMDVDEKTDTSKIKQEAVEERSARPGSSGGNKRSASVMSSVSDKSAKRQKK